MSYLMKKSGFTLVELSIVIVIIGFLVAGISAGTQLVKSAQLRSVIADIDELEVSYSGFISKYNYKPGDHPAAFSYFPNWGESAAACNGNGDGVIRWNNGAITDLTVGDEGIKAMYQLYYSGLYNKKGSFSSIQNGYGNYTSYHDSRWFPTMSSDSSNTLVVTGSGTSDFCFWTALVFPSNTHAIYIARSGIENGADFMLNGGLPAMESFQIDEKIDDGLATASGFTGAETGNFRAIQGALVAATIQGDSALCKTGNLYETTSSGKACIIGKKTSIQ